MHLKAGELDKHTEQIPQEINRMLMQQAIDGSKELAHGVPNNDLTYALYRASLLGYSVGVAYTQQKE